MSNQSQMVGGCCVCLDERGWKENPLVYCDGTGCNVAVHKKCYGITKVPSGPWYCQRCEIKEAGDDVRCCLCPKREGGLKQTEDNRWAHVLCALYLPHTEFGNMVTKEPIIVASIPTNSYNSKTCYICEENGDSEKDYGICLVCAKPACKVAFHVSCGQSHSLLSEEQGGSDSSEYRGYCPAHCKKGKSGKDSPTHTQGKNDAGSGTEDKSNFSVPLSVEVVEKPKSRSRAKPQASNANGPKPKRTRKPPTKKSAATLSKISPMMKSPLRSPLRSPSMRSPTLLSPGLSPISLLPTTSARGLLEQQFEMGQKMLENQAPLDIAQLLNCIGKIQQENLALEAELQQLTSRRDHLVSVNARLTLPMNTVSMPSSTQSTATPAMLTNGSINSLSGSSSGNMLSASRSGQNSQISCQLAPLALSSSTQANSIPPRKSGASIIHPPPSQPLSAHSLSSPSQPSQPKKRQAESVIKMNTKQSKPTSVTSSGTTKTSGKANTLTAKASNDSHFQWPTSASQPHPLSANSSPSPAIDPGYSQSVSSRLPPIDALSQSRVPSQQMSANTAYLNSAAPLTSYTVGSNAAAAMAANYNAYSQFPMFPMAGLSDMAHLNPSTLTGLAMQGLHNSQQYYRAAADAAGQNIKPN